MPTRSTLDSDEKERLKRLEAAGLIRIGKGFPPGFCWDDDDEPMDSEGAIRAALAEDREGR